MFAAVAPNSTDFAELKLTKSTHAFCNLCCVCIQITMPATVKKVPASMTLAQVKAFLARLFKLAAADIILSYRAPGADWPELLVPEGAASSAAAAAEHDARSLEYFGVLTGGQILVENRSAHRNANV